jgi:hypothetical protein
MQDPGKHFSLCWFFFVLQEKKKKKKAMASPSSSSLCRGTCYSELAATQASELWSFSGACISFMQQVLSPGKLRSLLQQALSSDLEASKLRAPKLAATQALELAARSLLQQPSSSQQASFELRSLLFGACCSKL